MPNSLALTTDIFKPVSHLALIFEESERLAGQVLANFSHWKLQVNGAETPVDLLTAPTTLVESGLEVADFIMHTAGAQARADSWPPRRRDYPHNLRAVRTRPAVDQVQTIMESKLN